MHKKNGGDTMPSLCMGNAAENAYFRFTGSIKYQVCHSGRMNVLSCMQMVCMQLLFLWSYSLHAILIGTNGFFFVHSVNYYYKYEASPLSIEDLETHLSTTVTAATKWVGGCFR